LKSAFITGISGFVGKYLAAELNENNVEVCGIGRNEHPEKSADVFYHLAWESAFGSGRSDPFVQESNVKLTLQMLNDAYNVGCKKFVALGTCYEKLSLNENFGNADFYILSKRYAHEIADRYAKKLGMEFVWTTVCQPIGAGVKPEQMIAYVVNTLKNGESPKMGPAASWYDIVSVKDLALGLRLVGENKLSEREYFIGSGKPRILKDYLSEIPRIINTELQIEIGARPDDGLRFHKDWFDISMLEKEAGYKPKVSFNDAILSLC
jgi:nucleoside-diphosphate-sugar epimerase